MSNPTRSIYTMTTAELEHFSDECMYAFCETHSIESLVMYQFALSERNKRPQRFKGATYGLS